MVPPYSLIWGLLLRTLVAQADANLKFGFWLLKSFTLELFASVTSGFR